MIISVLQNREREEVSEFESEELPEEGLPEK